MVFGEIKMDWTKHCNDGELPKSIMEATIYPKTNYKVGDKVLTFNHFNNEIKEYTIKKLMNRIWQAEGFNIWWPFSIIRTEEEIIKFRTILLEKELERETREKITRFAITDKFEGESLISANGFIGIKAYGYTQFGGVKKDKLKSPTFRNIQEPYESFKGICGPICIKEFTGLYHTCGIYIYKTDQRLQQSLSYGNIICVMSMWGNLIEYEEGYRAEFAYPKLIMIPESYNINLEDYGCPQQYYKNREDLESQVQFFLKEKI